MSTALELSSYRNNPAALSAFGKDREDRTAERAEAVKLGRGVAAGQQNVEAKVREVAEDFVSVFMNQVMKSMRETVHENPQMHGDNGEKFFQEMLDTEQSKSLAKGSGYGLTDLIYESLITSYRVREGSPAAAQAAAAGEGRPSGAGTDAALEAYENAGEPEVAAVAGIE